MTRVLPPPIRAVFDAANQGDTETFLAAFTAHQGFVDDWGRRFYGSEEIRRWSDAEFIGNLVTLSVVHFYSTAEDETVVIAQVGGNGFNGPSTFTFRIDNNKIAEMRIAA
ncbi:hypothetical protein OKHIL_76730 [Mycolicibacterium mageritense]|nr:hypothetical protein MTY414_77420 [Mycolicibacterium mageritense]